MRTWLWFLGFILSESVEANELKEPEYGQAYLADYAARILPRVHFGVAYATDISNSFMNADCIAANAQVRIWKYISSGFFGEIAHTSLTSAGKQVRDLEKIDFHAQIPELRWGLFSLSSLQL